MQILAIENPQELSAGLNYDALRRAGIDYAQRLSGSIWTDYNEHDPGITLLEHLCFALTDLAYRANFDVEELLYAAGSKSLPAEATTLYGPADILPTTPVSITDYRRLLIDQVRDIRNAWIDPYTLHPLNYRGLFRVKLQLADEIERTAKREDILANARTVLMANRNLGEDIDEIILLKTEHLRLSAKITIENDNSGEKVIADILHTVGKLLNPGLRFYSQEALTAEGATVEEIFDGPKPLRGFIRKEELRPLPGAKHTNDLKDAISSVTGVKKVEKFQVWKGGDRYENKTIKPSQDSALSLDADMVNITGREGEIQLFRNGVPVILNPKQTRRQLNVLKARDKRGFQLNLNSSVPQPIAKRTRREIADYSSLQRLLPTVYGVGADGLPATASREQRAQASQLKAYLLIFEQFMADYLAQLANVHKLFSIPSEKKSGAAAPEEKEAHAKTYFSSFPADIPNVVDLYRHGLSSGASKTDILAAIDQDLDKLTAKTDPADERRNRLLDHLLARFGEAYKGDALGVLGEGSREERSHDRIRGKEVFLRDYPHLSRDRGKGFDYTKPAWKTDNISGLKQRVALQLSLYDFHDLSSGERVIKYHNRPLFAAGGLPNLGLGDAKKEKGKEKEKKKKNQPRLPFGLMMRAGTRPELYTIEKRNGTYHLLFQQEQAGGKKRKSNGDQGMSRNAVRQEGADAGAADALKGRLLKEGSEEDCKAVKEKLIRHFQQLNDQAEGFFLLENILLRPKVEVGSSLVLEMDPGKVDPGFTLRSPWFTDVKFVRSIPDGLVAVAQNPSNWASFRDGDQWRLVLSGDQGPLLISTAFANEKDVEDGKGKFLDFFVRFDPLEKNALNDFIQIKEERVPGYDNSLVDFYNLRLSVIAPDWPALFQETDFRLLFHQIMAANVPAHLSVDYYWLSPHEMERFEGKFEAWLEALRKADAQLEQSSLEIVRALRKQDYPILTGEAVPGDTRKKLPAPTLRAMADKVGYAFMFPATEFGLFAGIPGEARAHFPALGIRSWKQLRQANAARLANDLTRLSVPVTDTSVRNWQRQAALAIDGNWSDLLLLQQKMDPNQPEIPVNLPVTKLTASLERQLSNPKILLDRIRAWVMALDSNRIVPFELIQFLRQSAGYEFFLSKDDPMIFSDVTSKRAAETRRQEAALARAGKWEELFDFQEEENGAAGPALRRFNQEQTALMAAGGDLPPADRPLAKRLLQWKENNHELELTPESLELLLSQLNYQDLLDTSNLSIFTDVGKKREKLLKNASVGDWRTLSVQNVNKLAAILLGRSRSEYEAARVKVSPVAARRAEELITQATLAVNGDWKELRKIQTGDIKPLKNTGTVFEQAIDQWLEEHGDTAAQQPTE